MTDLTVLAAFLGVGIFCYWWGRNYEARQWRGNAPKSFETIFSGGKTFKVSAVTPKRDYR